MKYFSVDTLYLPSTTWFLLSKPCIKGQIQGFKGKYEVFKYMCKKKLVFEGQNIYWVLGIKCVNMLP